MRGLIQIPIALSLTVIACQNRRPADNNDTAIAAQSAEAPQRSEPSAPAAVPPSGEGRSADSTAALATGKEPGTIPATRTPSVTSESSITSMRQHLQRLDNATAETLQRGMKDHSKMLGDLLTTMRVEVQAVTAPTKESWLASADSVESDLDRLALAQGEELNTAFRAHRTRLLRLLDGFRVLVPAKSI